MSTDYDWEKWGQNDPYYGVLSSDEYRSKQINPQSLERFFSSGQSHVDMVLNVIRDKFEPHYLPKQVLDFGCGVGRLLIPFAKASSFAVGVDIAPSMLDEARRNCDKYGIGNVGLVIADEKLGSVKDRFDLIHSYLVFQHIDFNRGLVFINELCDRVSPGGYLALQFYYMCNAPSYIRMLVKFRYRLPLVNYIRNIYRRRPVFEPAMQLHVYNMDSVLHILSCRGFGEVCQKLYLADNGEFEGVFLFAKKNSP